MKHLGQIALVASLVAGGFSYAQTALDWDSDGDGALSRDEWNAGMAGSDAFAGWDADISGMIDANEFSDGMYAQIDSNRDTTLSSTEWADAMSDLYGDDGSSLVFSEWDLDSDGALSRDEFSQEFQSSGLYDATRTMGNLETSTPGISEDEFGNATFDMMDRDRNQSLGADEGSFFR